MEAVSSPNDPVILCRLPRRHICFCLSQSEACQHWPQNARIPGAPKVLLGDHHSSSAFRSHCLVTVTSGVRLSELPRTSGLRQQTMMMCYHQQGLFPKRFPYGEHWESTAWTALLMKPHDHKPVRTAPLFVSAPLPHDLLVHFWTQPIVQLE